MAKSNRSSAIQEPTKDYLTKPKDQFKKEISERLQIGEELFNRPLKNQGDLEILDQDFSYWTDYNAELLRQSFENVNNVYYREYKHSGIIVTSISRYEPTLKEQIQETKEEISDKYHRLRRIYEKADLIEVLPTLNIKVVEEPKEARAMELLENLLNKFHKVAQTLRLRHKTDGKSRPTLMIVDEYDVQDLLRSLLCIHFKDVRAEDFVSSYAGSNSRVDFALPNEKIIIEVKISSNSLADKDLGSQLLADIGRYRKYPDCNALVVFIYDKGDHVINKTGLINDLEKMSTLDFKIRVIVKPD